MASNYTKTSWTNDSGQPVNDTNLNKIEQGIADASDGANIKTWYEAEADTNAYTDTDKAEVAKIAGIETTVNNLNDVGMTVLSGSNIAPQTIGLTPVKVALFDTIAIDVGTGTTGSIANQRASADVAGVYKLRLEAFVAYASNVDIEWEIYVSGVPTGNNITLAGHGTQYFSITLISALELLANDYVELYATASASTPMTVLHSNGTLEKTHY